MGKIKIKRVDHEVGLLVNSLEKKLRTETIKILCEVGDDKNVEIGLILEMEQYLIRIISFPPDDLSEKTNRIIDLEIEEVFMSNEVINGLYQELKAAYEVRFGLKHEPKYI